MTLVGSQPLVDPQPCEKAKRRAPAKGGVITSLSRVPRYDTLMRRGTIQGQCDISLVDGGETQNFIDTALVARKSLQIEAFEEFDVAIAYGHMVECLDRVPDLE
jgi:hypothetical protein